MVALNADRKLMNKEPAWSPHINLRADVYDNERRLYAAAHADLIKSQRAVFIGNHCFICGVLSEAAFIGKFSNRLLEVLLSSVVF